MFINQRFTIHTSLSPAEVRAKLAEVVEPRKTLRWRWSKSEKPYEGEIGEHSFKISRIINYRNSFLPQIAGRIQPNGAGSEVEITMNLKGLVIGFMLFWLGMVLQFGILFLAAMISEGKFEPAGLIPVGMFVFGCFMPFVGFVPEAKKSKQFLTELLER
ncbi:MAG: hypothetical protein F6J93_22510 [Oscillatoria sp. SIO1A7]|nr:hypothetical protein [Oscillatoria sp. SIO1A7]